MLPFEIGQWSPAASRPWAGCSEVFGILQCVIEGVFRTCRLPALATAHAAVSGTLLVAQIGGGGISSRLATFGAQTNDSTVLAVAAIQERPPHPLFESPVSFLLLCLEQAKATAPL